MPNQILLKRSNITGATPAPESLTPGELAINTATGNLYSKTDDGTVICLNPTVNPYYNYYSGPDANVNDGNWVNGLRSDNPGNEYFSGVFFGTPTVTDTSVPYAIGQGYKGPYGTSVLQAGTKSVSLSSEATNPNNGDVLSGTMSISPRLTYNYRHTDVNNNQLAYSTFGVSEGLLTLAVSQGQFPNTSTASLNIGPTSATLTYDGNPTWNANSVLTQGYADSRYAAIGGGGGNYTLPVAGPNTLGGIRVGVGLTIDGNGVLSANTAGAGVSTFNTRAGNVTLLETDVQPITDPLYLQVYKDTQTTQSALTQFGVSSFIQSGNLNAGFSRGLLTANTSGTTTRSIFDGNVYYNSANGTYPAYKRIAFNSNQTGGTNATGRLQINTYGGITGDSQATTSSFTRTVTFGVNSQTGVSLAGDITPAGAGANLYSGKLTSNGTNSGTESGSVFCGDLQKGVTIQGGTVGSPYTTSLNSTNTWPVANSNAPFPYTPDYRTWLTLGDTAELIFLQYSTQSVRTPTFTDNSILTQGYADTRYLTGDVAASTYVPLNNNDATQITSRQPIYLTSATDTGTGGMEVNSEVVRYTNSIGNGFVLDNYSSLQRVGYAQQLDEVSFVTLGDVNSMFMPIPSNSYNGSFQTLDGQTVLVENGIIVSVGKAKS